MARIKKDLCNTCEERLPIAHFPFVARDNDEVENIYYCSLACVMNEPREMTIEFIDIQNQTILENELIKILNKKRK